MRTGRLALILSSLAMTALAFGPHKTLDDPYGICAHVSRGEIRYGAQSFERMKGAGIQWVRTDYDWDRIQKKEGGEWNFAHLDKLHGLMKAHGVNILPILVYDVPWARPAYKHMDKWLEYVTKVVTRYQHDLPYWEVWNEENLRGFWRDTPDGAAYAEMLKQTYKTIKAINPNLKVVYGGTAGVPYEYIEKSLAAGAGEYFDIFAIHPYQWRALPETMLGQYEKLQAIMDKYGVGNKPLWITEVGWSTALVRSRFKNVFNAGFKHLGIDCKNVTLALVSDERYKLGVGSIPTLRPMSFDDQFKGVKKITCDEIATLDPADYPILLPAMGEAFPVSKYMPAIRTYLSRGGTLYLPTGLPFYYDLKLKKDGTVQQIHVGDRYFKTIHGGWEVWWTVKGIPEQEKWMKPAPGFEKAFSTKGIRKTGRFFTKKYLQEGDEFIPLVSAGTDDYTSQIAAIYKLNSDGLKGAMVVSSFWGVHVESVPEDVQARHLPRTYLLAFASGIEKVFWYNLRASEHDLSEREHCFGIVHKDLSPKPAYVAFQAMNTMFPKGSTRPAMVEKEGRFVLNWQRPDGRNVWAVWHKDLTEKVQIDWDGDLVQSTDVYGKPRQVSKGELTIGPELQYFVGPSTLTIK